MLEASWRDKGLLRIRYGAAALCYGFAWLSMVALIGMLTIAEALQGEVIHATPTLSGVCT